MTSYVAGGTDPLRAAWAAALGATAIAADELPARLRAEPQARALAFYRAPWEAFTAACAVPGHVRADGAALLAWAAAGDALLEAGERAGERVLLVNDGRLAGREAALAEALAARGWDATATPPTPVEADATSPGVLAALFEEHAPELCDRYEALESMAQLLGREPEFRGSHAGAAEPMADVLRVWGDAIAGRVAAREHAERLAAAEHERDTHLAELAALRRTVGDQGKLAQATADENELLLEHVALLRQEFADQAAQVQDLRETVRRLGAAADRARVLLSKS